MEIHLALLIMALLYPVLYLPAKIIIEIINDLFEPLYRRDEIDSIFYIIATKVEVMTARTLFGKNKLKYMKLIVLSRQQTMHTVFSPDELRPKELDQLNKINGFSNESLKLLDTVYNEYFSCLERSKYNSIDAFDLDITDFNWFLLSYPIILSIIISFFSGMIFSLATSNMIGLFLLIFPPLLLFSSVVSSSRYTKKARRALIKGAIIMAGGKEKLE